MELNSSTLSVTSALDEVGHQRHAPAALPPGKTRYPVYRRLGRPQGRSGRVQKISPPPGFDPRPVQPVASRYTEWATFRKQSRLLECSVLGTNYTIDGVKFPKYERHLETFDISER
jgi:hypothetical protein